MLSLRKITILCVATAAMIGAANAATPADSDTNTAPATLSKKAQRAENHQLAKKVRLALTKTKHLTFSHITVLARGGTVTLDGTVPTDEEIKLAGDTASNVQGVSKVTNNLTVQEVGR